MQLLEQLRAIESRQRMQQLLAKFRHSFTPRFASAVHSEHVSEGETAETVVLADSERIQYAAGRADTPGSRSGRRGSQGSMPLSTSRSSRAPMSSRGGSSSARPQSGLVVDDEFLSDGEDGELGMLDYGEEIELSQGAVDHFPAPDLLGEVTLVDIRKT